MEENVEEFDNLKTKVLKYVLYKKRTEAEIRQKFHENTGKMLDNVIELLIDNKYIDDRAYIERTVEEYISLNNMSIKEIQYKLLSRGIDGNLLADYISTNKDMLLEYEINSAKNIFIKKSKLLEEDDIIKYLSKKGFLSETIKLAIQEKEEN